MGKLYILKNFEESVDLKWDLSLLETLSSRVNNHILAAEVELSRVMMAIKRRSMVYLVTNFRWPFTGYLRSSAQFAGLLPSEISTRFD